MNCENLVNSNVQSYRGGQVSGRISHSNITTYISCCKTILALTEYTFICTAFYVTFRFMLESSLITLWSSAWSRSLCTSRSRDCTTRSQIKKKQSNFLFIQLQHVSRFRDDLEKFQPQVSLTERRHHDLLVSCTVTCSRTSGDQSLGDTCLELMMLMCYWQPFDTS